jgi:hypothetical protein
VDVPEIIGHAVWPYHVFSLSLRNVELILDERCIVVSYRPCDAGARNSPQILLTTATQAPTTGR